MLRKMSKFAAVACTVALLLICASPVLAQSEEKEKPATYTYVAQWGIPRADWGAYEKGNAATKQVMDKLVADGTITGYGWFRNLVHAEGAPTHGEWWTASSIANLMKALSSLVASTDSPDFAKILAGSKHWDYILTSRDYNGHSGTFENTYLRVSGFKGKSGEEEVLERTLKSYVIPTLEKLLADGAIHSYSIDHEYVHTEDPANFWIVVVTNGADGLDKVNAALRAAGKATPTGGPAFASSVDYSAHRDFLSMATSVHK
jgi:hypothetical protein